VTVLTRLLPAILSPTPVQLLTGDGLGSGVDLARPHRLTCQSERKCDCFEHGTRL
jgi:hypothetical protein